MDRTAEKRNRWAWLPEFMPGVSALITEKRRLWGDAHVNECWRRGVVERQPGWFFAAEGALTVGTPDADQRAIWLASLGPHWESGKGSTRAQADTPGQALLDIRTPEGARGTQA